MFPKNLQETKKKVESNTNKSSSLPMKRPLLALDRLIVDLKGKEMRKACNNSVVSHVNGTADVTALYFVFLLVSNHLLYAYLAILFVFHVQRKARQKNPETRFYHQTATVIPNTQTLPQLRPRPDRFLIKLQKLFWRSYLIPR